MIGDMLFSLMTLPMALGYIEGSINIPENGDVFPLFLTAFILMGIARLFRAFRYRNISRLHFNKFLIYGICILAGCLSTLAFDKTTTTRILLIVYWGSLIVDRVISCVRKRGLRNLLLNLVAIFLLVRIAIGNYFETEFSFFVMFVMVIHTLLSILAVSFARINLKSLDNVIRETYAAEIISGLLLLIFAFSYILKVLEPGLASLSDALWYCFTIVTTIGFGDITATTLLGRVLSVILGIYGIIVVALITSVIVNYYGEMKRENAQEGKNEDECV